MIQFTEISLINSGKLTITDEQNKLIPKNKKKPSKSMLYMTMKSKKLLELDQEPQARNAMTSKTMLRGFKMNTKTNFSRTTNPRLILSNQPKTFFKSTMSTVISPSAPKPILTPIHQIVKITIDGVSPNFCEFSPKFLMNNLKRFEKNYFTRKFAEIQEKYPELFDNQFDITDLFTKKLSILKKDTDTDYIKKEWLRIYRVTGKYVNMLKEIFINYNLNYISKVLKLDFGCSSDLIK